MNRNGVIARQAQQLYDAVRPLLRKGQSYSLVDFPSYANVGDSAIWLGAVKLLKNISGRDPLYVCSKTSYDKSALAATGSTGPIFILGGGNFGDLYQPHQDLRFALMRDFPDRKIVQLPQSIHFDSPDALAATAKAIEAHGNFHLFVRDQSSADIAKQAFSCPVELAPDCAFCIGPVKQSANKTGGHVFLRRIDKEIAGTEYSPLEVLEMTQFDWATEPPIPGSVTKTARLLTIAGGMFSRASATRARLNAQAQWRMNRGIDMLSQGEAVVTDRLHGMIISVLLGQPVVAFDNSYKKVSGYQKLWMADFEGAAVVETADEALKKLRSVQVAYLDGVA